jgi:parallel beta-helix repeat protein
MKKIYFLLFDIFCATMFAYGQTTMSLPLSTPRQAATTSDLLGNYTINGALPTGGKNFRTFEDAMDALSYGVAGPLTIDVAPGSGPYIEQVSIPAILNASATNPIVINGNGNTVQFKPVSGKRYIVCLDGADYVTVDSLNIVGLDSTFGWGIHFTNAADHNIISNCTIDLSAVSSTGSANSAGIIAAASPSGASADSNTGSYNTITGNVIKGAYTSITWLGTNSLHDAIGNKITGNTILDFYADGISLKNSDETILSYNDIQRPSRTGVASGSGLEIGSGCMRTQIISNRIHDTHSSATGGAFYGIYFNDCDAPDGAENRATNNLLYKFNSQSGTIYGFYIEGSDGTHLNHNTIVFDHSAATSGTTRGICQTNISENILIQNNIIYIKRGGSGTKHCLHFNTPGSSITSNNNNLYMAAASGSNFIGYDGGGISTLANWKATNNGAYDQQSVALNPVFRSATSADYTPTNTQMDDLGMPTGTLTDINGNARSLTVPDIGAVEFLHMPLSVTLNSFSGTRKADDVMLQWAMSAEKGISSYFVQRSGDGKEFDDIDELKAIGKADYSYMDRNGIYAARDGRVHYRLKVLEEDAQMHYSKIATIQAGRADELLSVYPNPFNEAFTMMVSAPWGGSCKGYVTDLFGRTLALRVYNVEEGGNLLEFDRLSNLPHGLYQLILDVNGKIFKTKLVK